MHPNAVMKGAGLQSIATRLDDAAARRDVPAVWVPGGEAFHGDHAPEDAARALEA